MKISLRLVSLAILFLSQPAFAQEVFKPYYVVIGGFKNEANAQKFSTYAHEQNLPAVYAFNEERGVYYVYVRATQTKDVADDILSRLRTSSPFRDAWVFNGTLRGGPVPAKKSSSPSIEEAPPEPISTRIADTTENSVEKEDSAPVTPLVSDVTPVDKPAPVGRRFLFKLVNGETGSAVNGIVRLQESDKALQFRGFNANEIVYVPAPNNKSGKWFVVCHVVGFRQMKKPIAYEEASKLEGASVGDGQEIIIPLQLERVRKGDYVEMEGVKFYNNSALFTPGSERELDELVTMMEENPDYHVRMHGHTNGNQSRDIVSLGTSEDFFNPSASNAKSHATARELSLLRAELVKAYLVSKGIAEARISTKGEGGTQMIVDAKGTLAGLNDRVEVEIRKH